MYNYNDLLRISKISDNIYLSGIYPLEKFPDQFRNNNINCILSCVDKPYVESVHNEIFKNNPDIEILYIPYDDDIRENLSKRNLNNITINKYISNPSEMNRLTDMNNFFNNKSMLDISYFYIDDCIRSGKNILIHCMAGVSRSASVLINYLMKKYDMEYDDAYKYLISKRSIVMPNESFKNQLKSIKK